MARESELYIRQYLKIIWELGIVRRPNNHMHSDSKKRRGFRYAPATPLFAAGDVKRYAAGCVSIDMRHVTDYI